MSRMKKLEELLGKQGFRTPVTTRALVQRINRKIAAQGLKYVSGMSWRDLEHPCLVDFERAARLAEPIVPEELGRLLGVLEPWEVVTDSPLPDAEPAAGWRRLAAGERVGRFEILREIGRSGEVYEALDRELRRRVAIKIPRPGPRAHALPEDLAKIEAAARLHHPGLVTLFDAFAWRGGLALVMELLHGETLSARLGRGPMPAEEALAVALGVAQALGHAHSQGLLHQNLKPGKVFLAAGGRVKLLDLGLTYLLGTSAGTPGYMAPEQERGGAGDARADVFALGVVLFEMLSGSLPFALRDGRSAALDGAAAAPLPKATPACLVKLVRRCLALDPADRPADGQAVAEELEARAHGGGPRS